MDRFNTKPILKDSQLAHYKLVNLYTSFVSTMSPILTTHILLFSRPSQASDKVHIHLCHLYRQLNSATTHFILYELHASW